jgi:peroxiredoxin
MRRSPHRAVVVAVAAMAWLGLAGGVCGQDALGRIEIGQHAPDFTLRGADGLPHRLADYAGAVVVLEWTSPVCPYTEMKYRSGAMQALQKMAHAEGDVWLSIDTAGPNRPGYLSPAAAKTRVETLHATVSAFLSDPEGKVARLYGARVTPTFFIIGPDGRLAYQGAMDDDPGADDIKGKNHVRDALGDLAAGNPVRIAETRPYGCGVEY